MNRDKVDIKTPEYVSLQFQLAGLGSRSSAFIIDQLIIALLHFLFFLLLMLIMNGLSYTSLAGSLEAFTITIIIIVIFILNWGYFLAFEYFSGGRTPGKRLMGIRVIQENGHSLTFLSCFIRNLMRIIDSLPIYYFLGIIMVFFHSKHKRLGDVVAGTIVIHERKAKRKQNSPIDKEIRKRGLYKESLVIEEWVIQSFGMKEWNLIKTYANRFSQLPIEERNQFTIKLANILFPKIGLDIKGMNLRNIENNLLVLYLILKDEWEYEL